MTETKEQFIDDLFGRTTIVIDRNLYRYIVFKIEDKICMEYNSKNDKLWCDWYRIWSVLEREYGCNDMEIKQLIRGKAEEHFKLNAVTPNYYLRHSKCWAEEHFKLNAVTPVRVDEVSTCQAEEHFKLNAVTPRTTEGCRSQVVEEQFKTNECGNIN